MSERKHHHVDLYRGAAVYVKTIDTCENDQWTPAIVNEVTDTGLKVYRTSLGITHTILARDSHLCLRTDTAFLPTSQQAGQYDGTNPETLGYWGFKVG